MQPTESRLRSLTFSVLVGTTCAFLAACGDYAAEGRAAFERGDHHTARRMLEVALKQDSASNELRFMLGATQMRMRRETEALNTLRPLFTDATYGVRSISLVVDAKLKRGDTTEIDALVSDATRQWPNNATTTALSFRWKQWQLEEQLQHIAAFLDLHGGIGTYQRHSSRVLHVLHSKLWPDGVKAAIDTLHAATLLPSSTELMSLLERARTSASALEQAALAAVSADATAYLAELALIAIDKARMDAAAAESRARRVLALRVEHIANPELREGLEDQRNLAAMTVAQAYDASREPAKAIPFLEEFLPTVKDKKFLTERLAWVYYISNELEKLDALAQAWLIEDSRNLLAAFYRGYVLFRLGRHQDAESYLELARGSNIKNQAFHIVSAMNYASMGNHGRAVSLFSVAADVSPLEPDALVRWAQSLKAVEEPERAREVLRTALRQQFPQQGSEAHRRLQDALMRLYQEAGHGIDSVVDARRLHFEDPTNAWVSLRLAQLENAQGGAARARDLCKEVQQSTPGLADAWRVGAEIALTQRDATEALRCIERLQRVEPNSATSAWLEARAWLLKKHWASARTAALTALERNPNDVLPAAVLVEAALEDGKPREALDIGTHLLDRVGDSASLLIMLARAATQLSEHGKAADWLLRAEKLEPLKPAQQRQLALALLRAGKRADSQSRTQALLADATLSVEERIQIARIMLDLGDHAAASDLCLKLLPMIPKGAARTQTLSLAAEAHLACRRWAPAGAVLLEMRKADALEAATRLWIRSMAAAQRHAELALSASLALDDKAFPPECLDLAARAAITANDQRLLGLLVALDEKRSPSEKLAFLPLRAQWLHRQNNPAGARKLLREALSRGAAATRAEAAELLADWAHAEEGPKAALAEAHLFCTEAPQSWRIRMLLAACALQVGDLESAQLHAADAARLQPTEEQMARFVALTAICRGDLGAAQRALKDTKQPESRFCANLLAGLTKTDPAAGSCGAALAAALAGNLALAQSTLATADDLSASQRQELNLVLARALDHKEQFPLFVRELGTALILMTDSRFAIHAERALTAAERALPAVTLSLQHWRTRVQLQLGRGAEAARFVQQRLDVGKPTDFLLVLAAEAAARNAGTANIAKVLASAGLDAALPGPLAMELADLARTLGDETVALALMRRIASPAHRELALRVQMLARSGDFENACRSVLYLKDAQGLPRLTRMILACSLAHSGAVEAGQQMFREAQVGFVAADERDWLVVCAAAAALLPEPETARLIELALADSLSASLVHNIAQMLQRLNKLKDQQLELEALLQWMDPVAALRKQALGS
jgi:predicted Zn-dependent protease